MRDKNHIQSLERGLTILELVGASSTPPSLTEVAGKMRLTKTTTQRFLQTLCALGYLSRTDNKRFVSGYRVLSLGFKYLDSSKLLQVAKPFVDSFSILVQGTVNLAVRQHSEVVFLYRKEFKRFLKFDLHPGSKLPCHCTASGKVLLSNLEDEKLAELLEHMPLEKATPRTLVSKQALWADLMETRARGYSICDRELSMDLISMAVLLFERDGHAVAAMNVSLDVKDCDSTHLQRVSIKLVETGRTISRALGYKGEYPRRP